MKRTQACASRARVFVTDLEHIKGVFRQIMSVEPKTWKCPCDQANCMAWVVYARAYDDRIYFMSTHTFSPNPPYPTIWIDNVEDFDLFLRSDLLPAGDLLVYQIWLKQGLKEAILSA